MLTLGNGPDVERAVDEIEATIVGESDEDEIEAAIVVEITEDLRSATALSLSLPEGLQIVVLDTLGIVAAAALLHSWRHGWSESELDLG